MALRGESFPGKLGDHLRRALATTDITLETFEETVTKEGIVFVDFWADWCGPCKMFAPVFEKAAEDNPDITFAKVDTEAEQVIAQQAQITSIPTLMAFRDGILVFRQPGALNPQQFNELIGAVKDLDMDEVRQKIAEQENQ